MAEIEKLRQRVAEAKRKVAEARAASPEPRSDARLRALRKQLKRAQRRLRKSIPVSIEEQVQRSQRVLDQIQRRLDELVKVAKKQTGDPYVHSLRKKVKSFTRKIRRLTQRKERQAKPPP